MVYFQLFFADNTKCYKLILPYNLNSYQIGQDTVISSLITFIFLQPEISFL